MDEDAASPQTGRAKRQKLDKKGRLSALQKLREQQVKGSKNKYEVDEVDNVYDILDEREYSKKVLERQDDDWIEDDDGHGYVEDGREMFDDDLDSESIQASRVKESGPRKKKGVPKGKGNIRNMLVGMAAKKETQVKLDEDDVLKDLMAELKSAKAESPKTKKREPNKFLVPNKSKIQSKKPPEPPRPSGSQQIDDASDDEDIFSVRKIEKKVKKAEESAAESLIVEKKSQEIDDSSDTEAIVDRPQSPKKLATKTVDSSQIIEDVSCYTEDLSTFDFDDSNQGFEDKPKAVEEKTKVAEAEDADMLNDLWDDDFGEQMTEIEISVDKSELPLHALENGQKVFRFWWWDAFEDVYKQPGVVYLFGKVWVESAKAYVSCCVTVKDIERRIYLLPRENVKPKPGDEASEPEKNTNYKVYQEFNEYTKTKGIKEYRSRTVNKSYAFEEKGVPKTSEYIEVRYSFKYPPVDPKYNGNCIERVFGTSVNSLELLLVERKIKGPCWLDVKCPTPTRSPVSWCKIEVETFKMLDISLSADTHGTPPPPMVVATLNVRATFNTKSQNNQIAMIAVLLHHKYHIDKPSPKPPFTQHFCLITRPEDAPWLMVNKESLSRSTQTEVIHCEKERDVLERLLEKIEKCDPDLIVGYDCGFQLDVLMHRAFNLRVSNWSRIGRLRRTVPTTFKGKVLLNHTLSGRLVCDIQTSAKELNLKVRSYDLPSLCTNVLKKNERECKEVKPEDVTKYYANPDKLVELVRLTMIDASYIIMIMFELNVMPLALQITCIAGNILSRTLSAGRAERNEYLLLHAFYDRGYITPDKRNVKAKGDAEKKEESNPRKKKAAYAGGLVLDPKKGFYDTLILLMDFNSLYPSIIQEYNICFTTVPGAAYADSEELSVPETDLEPGVIPTEIRKLVESRGQVKNLMKAANISQELKMQYNTRQLALKLTANSMYGCLGATHSRFYAKGLAALVTAKGREILINTKDLVERLNYQVIYGDTDSIMINTNVLDFEQVFAVGKRIKQEVNKLYKKVELDIDGVFRYLLLLQKKKYAAVTIARSPNGQLETTLEYKGIDIVRRDWCQLACEAGRNVLDQLLCDQPYDTKLEKIFELLRTVSTSLKDGNVPLSSLVITKQLSKNPGDYPDKKQCHVSVALRLNEKGGRMWKSGDTVPYVICIDGTDNSATERAYHVDELKNSESLKVDVNYYLLSQLFPVIMRICEPIEGIDDVLLSEHLGVFIGILGNNYIPSNGPQVDDMDVPMGNRQRGVQWTDPDQETPDWMNPFGWNHGQTEFHVVGLLTLGRPYHRPGDHLMECMTGIYKPKQHHEREDLLPSSDEDKFKYCEHLKFFCQACRTEISMDGAFSKTSTGVTAVLLKCPNTECSTPPWRYLKTIQNRLQLAIRSVITKYYEGWMECEDPACFNKTRRVPQQFFGVHPVCDLCQKCIMYRIYTETQLYNQITFYHRIFDIDQPKYKNLVSQLPADVRHAYNILREFVEKQLRSSAYSIIDLTQLFSYLDSNWTKGN